MIKNLPVKFHFLKACTLPRRNDLKKFILSIFEKEKKSLDELRIIFCDDEYLLALNRHFLQHDYYTDILSFPLSEPNNPLNAEIYISIDRVTENAKDQGSSVVKELHRVIFHGILHFCGYRDKSNKEQRRMRLMEDECLMRYFK